MKVENFSRLVNGNAEIAQGYVRRIFFNEKTGEIIHEDKGYNTVVNDARRSAASAFANIAGNVGLGFRVDKYRCGFTDVVTDHWDAGANLPMEVDYAANTLLPQYAGPSYPTKNYFHTQATVDGLSTSGLHFTGTGNPLAQKSIPLSVTYPFNGDENAVKVSLTLDGTTSVGAVFDTVEIVSANGKRFAARFLYPMAKMPSWGLTIEHLILF